MATIDRLHQARPALSENIAVLRHAVMDYATAHGAGDGLRRKVALATSEAVSNAVMHAYVGAAQPGAITVEAWVEAGRLIVLVRDDGRGMVPRPDSPGLGLGLPLIAQMTERVDVEDPDDAPGTRVRMTFSLAG
jgi:serine/threonine-protein kinase RsbW/stage II sporulation protein AB (anti-sigma F factor)